MSVARSMTGFARVRKAVPGGEVVVSLKSVNHRGLDLHFHMPPELDEFENSIRVAIKRQMSRGHVQLHVALNGEQSAEKAVNVEMLGAWLSAFESAAARFEIESKPDLNVAFRIPGMFQGGASVTAGAETGHGLMAAVDEALTAINEFRDREGDAIAAEMATRTATIRELAEKMEKIRSQATKVFHKRLKERLSELLHGAGIEPQRLAQEAALLADRSDISEELVRLRTHSAALDALLQAEGEKGKKLDFLLQEMNRESNTILSKTGGLGELGLTITDLALAAKAEIDKIREQSLNIE